MARRPRLEHLHESLGSEGRSVLAVLLLAAGWPERFPGGWVSVDEFGRCGLYLGERVSRESLKAAIRRGLRGITALTPELVVETRRTTERIPGTTRAPRELDRRLAGGQPVGSRGCLAAQGCEFLTAEAAEAVSRLSHHLGSRPSDQRHVLSAAIAEARRSIRAAARRFPSDSREGRALAEIRAALQRGLAAAQQRD